MMLLIASPAFSKLPELDTIFYGQVNHNTSQPLIPQSSQQIVVIAKLNGIAIATSSVAPGASTFVLKVPMDDGIAPRLIGTARSGERVRIYLRSNTLNTEYETVESTTSNGLLVASTKGEILPQSLTVTENLNGGAQAMPMFLASYGLSGTSGSIDSDGDGANNADEYAAGTSPINATEFFRILEVTKTSNNNFIKFGPIRPGRLYTIWCSETLGQAGWSNLGQVSPGVVNDYFLFGHASPSSDSLFYRLEVSAP